MKPKEVIELAKKNDVKFVDLKFIDFPGMWQHTTHPGRTASTRHSFEDGIGFDGSSIRGWQPINASRHAHDPGSASRRSIDPFFAHPTLVARSCTVYDPITKQPYSRDPRHIAKKAEAYLTQTGIADTCVLRPRGRVLRLRRRALRHSKPNEGYYYVDSRRGARGTRAARSTRTSATRCATRKATSRSRRPTRSRTSAPR